MVVERLCERWQLGRAKDRYRGRLVEGRLPATLWQTRASIPPEPEPAAGASALPEVAGAEARAAPWALALPGATGAEAQTALGASAPSGSAGQAPHVALLCPQTYMNDAGRSVGPACGALKVALDRVLVVHDEIDLPFGDVRTRLGGGLAGHNGLKSIKRELGSGEFARARVGVGRPASSDPEIVSAYVLGRFREPAAEVDELIERACGAVEQYVLGIR